MNITANESLWVTLRPGDTGFTLQDSITQANRASIEILNGCPRLIIDQLNWAVDRGYIRAVATVPKTDPTLMWEILKK